MTASTDDWRHDAACLEEDPELFFPVGTTPPALAQTAEAKAVCARCDVVDQCAALALDTRQEHGVWGGLDETERRAVLRQQTRKRTSTPMAGRPRSDTGPRDVEAVERAIRLVAAGMQQKTAAEVTGLSAATVSRYWHEHQGRSA